MRIVRLAFDDLVVQHELGRTEVSRKVELTDPIRLSASELAYLLFRDRSDSAKRKTRRMIQSGDIRAVTVGSGAGCKYEVSMQELILRILASVPDKVKFENTED